MTSRLELIGNIRAGCKQGIVELNVLMNGDRAIAAVTRGNQTKLAPSFRIGKSTLLISRLQAFLLGMNPDLKKVNGLSSRGIELAVADAGSCAHTLHFARLNHFARARTVLVRKLASDDV